MDLSIPLPSLVLLVGPSGSGKSTFARRHFRPTAVLSSDAFRAMVCDDEGNQAATADAFDVLHLVAAKRLAAGRLTVVDATNLQPDARRTLRELATRYHLYAVAVVFDIPAAACLANDRRRPGRAVGEEVIARHLEQLHRTRNDLPAEGYRHLYVLHSLVEIDAARIDLHPLASNRRRDEGPFDLIGDVHGCYDELLELLARLGYQARDGRVFHPAGRRAIFLGDLVDRGPRIPDVLRLVMDMVASGDALCVPGNHDMALRRRLKGGDVRIAHGLAESLEQLGREPAGFTQRVVSFLDGLVSHYVLDHGRLVVAHAGMRHAYQGRVGPEVRRFAIYGETTGEIDAFGLHTRWNWAGDYDGRALVVYGHTPVAEPDWQNHTVNIDTGCVFGGRLTALRYPERELAAVDARREYTRSLRPLR